MCNVNYRLACGLPYCSIDQKQTHGSFIFRLIVGVLASTAITIGILALCHLAVISHLGLVGGAAMTSVGSFFFLIALSIRCIKNRVIIDFADPEQISAINVAEQSTPKRVTILEMLQKKLNSGKTISDSLQEIPSDFFEAKSQERAQKITAHLMQNLYGASIEFPKSGALNNPEGLQGVLDPDVFQQSIRKGVEKDIINSAGDGTHVHVYQVASQYNAAEAPNAFTPNIGKAMETSKSDHTQGPLAQRTNPPLFEIVTAFLTHLGFNMLNDVLPTAGTTFTKGGPLEHGYLRPNDNNIDSLTEEFKKNFSKAEYVCYSSIPKLENYPIYIFLQAAPAIGYAKNLKASSDDLQKYAALANYLALFRHGIKLAKQRGLPVVLHATTVGGGVFKNTTQNLQWGFEKAALAMQADMKAHNVVCQLEVSEKASPATEICKNLNIPLKPRKGL